MTNQKFGDTGSLVELIQLALIRSGFLSGSPDGIFGPITKEAVINFQSSFSLTPDGIVGINTMQKLERYIKGFFIKTILKGETLWSIATMFGTSLQSIITANPDIDYDKIYPGDKITVPYNFPVVPTEISYSSYLVKLILEGLTARYPFITKMTVGRSVMGKDLEALKIGTGKKEIFINAAFHANEWLNIPVVLKFAEEYMQAISKYANIEDINADNLYKETCLYLVPIVNPDGVDIVTGANKEGIYYENTKEIANNFPNIPFPKGWKANINGVDLNLQFPAGWEKAKEIKFSQGFIMPSPIEYVGEFPLSAIESKSMFDFTNEHNFKIILAYHSQGSIIYWKYLDFLPPESERIANELSTVSGYPLEITPENSSYAGYKDWFIKKYNRPGYTIETGRGTNPLPIEQFDKIYTENKKLIVTAIKETSAL